MTCNTCGAPLENGATFCPTCGAAASENNLPTAAVSPSSVLTFGIISLASSVVLSCMCIGSVLAVVFGILALKNANKYNASTTVSSGQVTTGKILGIIGLILGGLGFAGWLLYVIFYALYFVFVVFLGASGAL